MNTKVRDLRDRWDRLVAESKRQVLPEMLPFPTEAQQDLLRAALLPPEEAAPAWARWKARGLNLDTVGDSSFRLLGRLWANRDAAAVGAEDLGLLKGVYRQTFADNVAKLTAALDAAQILVDAGIPLLFFKGAALIATCDETLGLRRIADVDLLIPEQEAQRAADLLSAAGYQPGINSPWACNWRSPASPGYEIDLHRWAFKHAGDDSTMFETAQEASLLGRPVLVPSATESLLVVIGNAFWRDGLSMRWIADSLLLLRTATIDWDLVLQRADRPGLMPGLAAGLGYLATTFGAPVPAGIVDQLRRRPVSWQARSAYWAATNTTFTDWNWVQFETLRAHGLHRRDGAPSRGIQLQTMRLAIRSAALLSLRCGNLLIERLIGRSGRAPEKKALKSENAL